MTVTAPQLPYLANYPISPCNIDTSGHFYEVFGDYNIENNARMVIIFMQEGGEWVEFSKAQLSLFCKRRGGNGFSRASLEQLVSRGLLHKREITQEVPEDQQRYALEDREPYTEHFAYYSPTHRLIAHTFAAYPAKAVIAQ